MLTAASRISPSNSGCSSGAMSKMRKKKEMTRRISAPKIEPIGAAGAAQQRGAADDHRGDGIERIGAGLRDIGIAGRGLDGEEQAAAAGEETAEREGGDLGALDRKPRHIGRAFGRADRIDGAAGDRAPERHPDQERDQDQQHERHRDPGEGRKPGCRAIVEDWTVEAKSPSELVSAQLRSSSILPPGVGRRNSATPI